MDVQRARHTLRKLVNLGWSTLTSSVSQIAADCEVRPSAFGQVFDIIEDDETSMKVIVNPVAFRLKETAKADRAGLFATVRGKVNFSIDGDLDPPLACHFATTVGYFRIRGNKLDHILGIHYDYDNHRPAHPVFHAQVTSCVDHLDVINEHYRSNFQLENNLMTGVAAKVRVPTAHMDPLAVFVQLIADHLVNSNSGLTETTAFERTRRALMFFKSDPRASDRLGAVLTEGCFRGPRWYLDAAPEPQAIAAP